MCFHGSMALMQEAQVRVGAFHARELKAFTEWYEKGQPSQLLFFFKGVFLSFSCRLQRTLMLPGKSEANSRRMVTAMGTIKLSLLVLDTRRVQLPAFFIFRTIQGGGGGSEEWLGGLYPQASPIAGAFCTSSHGHFEMSLILQWGTQ